MSFRKFHVSSDGPLLFCGGHRLEFNNCIVFIFLKIALSLASSADSDEIFYSSGSATMSLTVWFKYNLSQLMKFWYLLHGKQVLALTRLPFYTELCT